MSDWVNLEIRHVVYLSRRIMHQDVVCDPIHSDISSGGWLVLDRVLTEAKQGLCRCKDARVLQRPKE